MDTATESAATKRTILGLPRRIFFILLIVVVVGAIIAWQVLARPKLPPGIAGGNGRLEANEVYVSTKYSGRIKDVLVDEGDMVEAGQVVARMDTETLEAQLRQALAQMREAEDSRRVALADVATKRAEISVKQADYTYANQQYQRSKGLVGGGAVSEQEAQTDAAHMLGTRAELVGSRANLTGAEAAAGRALSSIEAARAEADRIRAEIKDSVLVAPIRARVETRLAEPGEVLGAGGRVLSLVDLSDVYMYIFLPERVTGKIALGSDARIRLDAAPQYPIRAFVSYVSPMAQFTPKTVETEEERHNLTFRVKLQIDKARLRQFEPLVKVGIPGMGYVRFDNSAHWPTYLQPPSVVPTNLWKATGRREAK